MEIQILKFALLSPLNFSIFGILDIFKMLICSINVNCYEINPLYIALVEPPNFHRILGRSESTSSLAFEVLMVKSEIDFINLFIFNYFNVKYKFVYLHLFNVKYKFIQLQLFVVKFLFSEEHIFSQAEENGCLWTRVLIFGCSTQPGKWWPVIFETQINFWGKAPCARTY